MVDRIWHLGIVCFFALAVSSTSGWTEELPPPPPSAPAERKVALNITVDRPTAEDNVELKTKTGELIAKRAQREKLEYEVVITGPHDTFQVYFDVPVGCAVYNSYIKHKDKPQKVLKTLNATVRDPIVRVVAMRQLRYTDQFRGTDSFRRLVFNDPWRAFYEVTLLDSPSVSPVYVQIPPSDREAYRLMNAALANDDPHQRLAVLWHLNGQH